MNLDIPILFLFFNRPKQTKVVFDEIKKAKPKKLYLASDGARNSTKGESDIVLELRSFILNEVDWDCKVLTLFRDKNLGCGKAVYEAINWLFENESTGIILEDDCLPSESFFSYCSENLDRYLNDQRIMAISGNNFLPKELTVDSYFFSRHFHMWGWATWKRTWIAHKDLIIAMPKILIDNNVKLGLKHKKAVDQITKNAAKSLSGEIDTWDFQLIFSFYLLNGLTIVPKVNLVKNIGFGVEATHTKKQNSLVIIERNEIEIPLNHPNILAPKIEYDYFLYNKIFQWRSFWKRAFDLDYLNMILVRFGVIKSKR